MKLRLLLAFVWLAISFALPIFGQEKEEDNSFRYHAILASPQLAQQLDVINRQLDEAFNKHDAVAVAALFTTNATLVAPLGIVSGRDGVEKYFTDVFQRANPSDQVTKISYVLCLWWRFMRNWRAEFDYEPRAPDPRRGLSDTRVYPCARYLEDSCGSG
jgi:energy-converting hydrogenase Eha subunit A